MNADPHAQLPSPEEQHRDKRRRKLAWEGRLARVRRACQRLKKHVRCMIAADPNSAGTLNSVSIGQSFPVLGPFGQSEETEHSFGVEDAVWDKAATEIDVREREDAVRMLVDELQQQQAGQGTHQASTRMLGDDALVSSIEQCARELASGDIQLAAHELAADEDLNEVMELFDDYENGCILMRCKVLPGALDLLRNGDETLAEKLRDAGFRCFAAGPGQEVISFTGDGAVYPCRYPLPPCR